MRKNYTNSDRVIFKIDVKIGQRILTLNVIEGDSIVGLLLKHNIAPQSDIERLNDLKEKIIINIQKQIQIKRYSNQNDLAQRMEDFLKKQSITNKQTVKNQKKFTQQQSSVDKDLSKQKQTPFKMLFDRTQNFINMNQTLSLTKNGESSNKKFNKKFDPNSSIAQLRESTGPINSINHLNPKHKNFNHSKKKSQYSRYSQSYQKISSRKVDDDLIKAYEVILLKSKDKTMREMAQKTLKQLKIHQQHQNKPQQFHIMPYINQENNKKVVQVNLDKKVNKIQELPMQHKQDKPIKIDQFSRSRQMMRKANKYSYLGSQINLTYEYEKENHLNDKKQHNYKHKNEQNNQTLKIQYNAQTLIGGNINGFTNHNNKRYNYLFD